MHHLVLTHYTKKLLITKQRWFYSLYSHIVSEFADQGYITWFCILAVRDRTGMISWNNTGLKYPFVRQSVGVGLNCNADSNKLLNSKVLVLTQY